MKQKYAATIEKRGRWYIGYIDDVPGANTQGRTLKEVSENLKEVLALVLEAQRDFASEERPTKVYRRTVEVEV